MTKEFNYLPFVKREVLNIAAAGRGFVSIPFMGRNEGIRKIIGDVTVYEATKVENINMRIGITGRGYMTEDFYKIGSYCNAHRPFVQTWKFPKPYEIRPGQRMTVRQTARASTSAVKGVMFSGIRVDNQQPILLHDATATAIASGTYFTLNNSTMQCPHDTPIELYSFTISENVSDDADGFLPTVGEVQVYGPDDREWFEMTSQVVPAPAGSLAHWVAPIVSPIELGEERGWVLDPGQAITFDFENDDAAYASNIEVTVRGSYEVPV